MLQRIFVVAIAATAMTLPTAQAADPKPFSDYILKAVTRIYDKHRGQGYNINSYFTHDLPYGPDCCIKANNPPRTMCVAAVAETIVEALNIYLAETDDRTPFRALNIDGWRRGRLSDIRAHLFEYKGTNSRGAAHALQTFGIGVVTSFEQLKPGGLVKFDRSKSGHSTIFLSFIDGDGNDVGAYNDSVAGFRYFSAQGEPGAGFGYRWAYFKGRCPVAPNAAKTRDCGVVRGSVVSGYMLHPADWNVQAAKTRFLESYTRDKISALLEQRGIAPTDSTLKGIFANKALSDSFSKLVAPELEEEGELGDLSRYDGVTEEEEK